MSSAGTQAAHVRDSFWHICDVHVHRRTVKRQEICYRAWMTYLAAGCGAAGVHLAGGHLRLLSPRSWRHQVQPVRLFRVGRPHGEDQGWWSCQGGRLRPPGPESQESMCVCWVQERHKQTGIKPRKRSKWSIWLNTMLTLPHFCYTEMDWIILRGFFFFFFKPYTLSVD